MTTPPTPRALTREEVVNILDCRMSGGEFYKDQLMAHDEAQRLTIARLERERDGWKEIILTERRGRLEAEQQLTTLQATLAEREVRLRELARSHDEMLSRLGEAERDLYSALHDQGTNNGMWGKWCARLLDQRDAAVQALSQLQQKGAQ